MIVALRALGVGDLATAVPALRGLRAAYPDEELALAAPAWLAPLVRLIGGVDRLVDVPDLDSPPPALQPAVAVNLHGRGPQSHRLLRATRPNRLLAFACDGFPEGPQWTDGEHEVRRWCRMLRWHGVAADPTDLALSRPASDGVPVGATVIHAGAKAPERRWPPARFRRTPYATVMAVSSTTNEVCSEESSAPRNLTRIVWPAYAARLNDFWL